MEYIAAVLICATFIIGITPRVDAAFAPSEMLTLARADRAADLAAVQKTLEIKMVRERLANLGFTHDEIQGRLSDMSDEQLHKLALQLDNLKVGGNGLEVVIALLVIAILVVLLIQLTGHRVIVK